MKKFLRIFGISLAIGVSTFLLAWLLGDAHYYDKDFFFQFGFWQLYSVFVGGINMYFFDYLDNIDWKGRLALRILINFLAAIVVTSVSLFLIRALTEVFVAGKTFESFVSFETEKNIALYVIVSAFVVTLVLALTFFSIFKSNQEKKLKESQFVAKTVSAKFESLKSQLDPHFLFNSLNVLTALIGENPSKAEDFTTKLSKVYRYVLEQKNKDLIPLEVELKFAETYMDLIRMRFEDGMSFEVRNEISDLSPYKIVPLTLQLLLENCIKHNSLPLSIVVEIKEGYIEVINNLNTRQVVQKGTQLGLSSIRRRYELISNRSVNIEKSNNEFRVSIPLLIQKAKTMEVLNYTNEDKYKRARARVNELKEYYASLCSYVLVIPFLIYINLTTFPDFHWFWFTVFGWGLGICIQTLKVFGIGKGWEQRQIEKIMNKNN